jgi:hypothetical protein
MPAAFDVSGVWVGDDGAIYYVRQLPDDSVTWAGFHDSGFHLGTRFTNVFQGHVAAGQATISGNWIDVPRGENANAGTVTFDVVLTPDGEPRELKRTSETGGFAPTTWIIRNGVGPRGPQDIGDLAGKVQRYDVALGENNPPCRDFTVMWGTIGKVGFPKLPPTPDSYCSFIGDSWDGDGDIVFDLTPDFGRIEPDFWTSAWVNRTFEDPVAVAGGFGFVLRPANEHILWLFDRFRRFHCELPMFGRENGESACSDPPSVLLPGWFEEEGNSILANGRPINGVISQQTDHRPRDCMDPPYLDIVFNLGPAGKQIVELRSCDVVRVIGVVADDAGHEGDTAPEIHPVYAVDVVQDFSDAQRLTNPHVNLTGVWHANDVGTYYVRQIDQTIWWLGLSHDQGRLFANVFQGILSGQIIDGAWVDVPMGAEGSLAGGSLTIYCGNERATQMTKLAGDAFGASTWIKLYDRDA